MAPTLYGEIAGPSGFLNNTKVYAYAASRFTTPPQAGTVPPSGAADASAVSTPTNGGPGQYVLEVSTSEDYYIGCPFPTTPDGGTNASTKWYWTYDQSLVGSGGVVRTITEGVSTVFTNDIEIGGTAQNVTLQLPDSVVIYDPTQGSGDPANNYATTLLGLPPNFAGLGAVYGMAVWSETYHEWEWLQGAPGLPFIYPNVIVGNPSSGATDTFYRFDTTSGALYLNLPSASFTGVHGAGGMIVKGSNSLTFHVDMNIAVAFSSFPSYGDATIHLVSAAALPSTGGDIFITPVGGTPQYVAYTGKSGNDLTGCTWTGPSAGWSGITPGVVFGSADYFDYVGGPQHLVITGVNAGIFFVADKQNKVWARLSSLSSGGGVVSGLTRTAVKTGTYTAVTGDLIPADISAGGFTITLPNAPVTGAQVAVKLIAQSTNLSSPNALTVATAGADVLNKAGGGTSYTMAIANTAANFQYDSSTKIWTIISDDAPISNVTARTRSATITVAASDSSAAQKSAADFVCSGNASTGGDAATIMQAYRALTALNYGYSASQKRGRLVLSEGTFYLESSLYFDVSYTTIDTQGLATRLQPAANFLGTGAVIIGSNPMDHPTWGGLYFSTDDAPTSVPVGVTFRQCQIGNYSQTTYSYCSGLIVRASDTLIERIYPLSMQYDGIIHEGFMYVGAKGDTPITLASGLAGGTGSAGTITVATGHGSAFSANQYVLIGNPPSSSNFYASPSTFTASASNVVTVSSSSDNGIQLGAIVVAPSGGTVPAGTKVVSISGTTLTLSQAVTLSANSLNFYGYDYEMVRVLSVAGDVLTLATNPRCQNNTYWLGNHGASGPRHATGSYIMPIFTTSAKSTNGPTTTYTNTTKDCYPTAVGRDGYAPRPFVDDSEWINCLQSGGGAVTSGSTPLNNSRMGFLIGASACRFIDCHPFGNTTNGVYGEAVSVTNSGNSFVWLGGEIETNGQGSGTSTAVIASLTSFAGGITTYQVNGVVLDAGISMYGNYPNDAVLFQPQAARVSGLVTGTTGVVQQKTHSIYVDTTNATSTIPCDVQITNNSLKWTSSDRPSTSVVYIFGNSAANASGVLIANNQIDASAGAAGTYGSVELHACAGAVVTDNQVGGSIIESGTADYNLIHDNTFNYTGFAITSVGSHTAKWDNFNLVDGWLVATGDRVAVTQANNADNTTKLATTAFVQGAIGTSSLNGDVTGGLATSVVQGIKTLPITGSTPSATLNRALFSDSAGNMQFAAYSGDIATKASGVGALKTVGLNTQAIATGTLATANGQVYIWDNDASQWVVQALSGDVTQTKAGVVTIANLAVTAAKIAANTITDGKMAANTLTGGSITSSVALAGSPTTTTQTPFDSSTKIATTQYSEQAILSAQAVLGPNDASSRACVALTHTINGTPSANQSLLTAGLCAASKVYLAKGTVINHLSFRTGTTAATFGSSGQHWWVAICDNTLSSGEAAPVVLASSADKTNTAIAASSTITTDLSGAFTATYSGFYYFVLMINVGTGGSPVMPTINCMNTTGTQFTALHPTAYWTATPTNGASAQPTASVALGGTPVAVANSLFMWAT